MFSGVKKGKEAFIEISLAWRNVWKNPRRTLLTLMTILIGCAMIIFLKAIQKGTFGQMIDEAVAVNAGHIQIHEKGFWENQTIDYAFLPDAALFRKLKSVRSIQAYSRRVYASGLVSSGGTTEGVLIQAVDPVEEPRVTEMHRFVLPGGRYLAAGDRSNIILGETLARNLGVKVGDSISMISQGFDGSFAAANLGIAGLFRTGNPEYDRALVIMPLSRAMDIFSMENYVSAVVIRLGDTSEMERVRDLLRKSIAAGNIEIMGWDQLMPDMVQLVSMKQVSYYVFSLILFMIVSFGVLNTIQMSVYERTREFGIMLAIGTGPASIRRMVQIESIIITIMGILLGVALGSGLGYYFSVNPIDLSRYAAAYDAWSINVTTITARLEVSNLLFTGIVLFVLTFIFTISPARRASRLRPVQAIQQL